jgi:hypothetical protein
MLLLLFGLLLELQFGFGFWLLLQLALLWPAALHWPCMR